VNKWVKKDCHLASMAVITKKRRGLSGDHAM